MNPNAIVIGLLFIFVGIFIGLATHSNVFASEPYVYEMAITFAVLFVVSGSITEVIGLIANDYGGVE